MNHKRPHTFVSLANDHFTARVQAGQCLINVAGMTWDCEVTPHYQRQGFSYSLVWRPYGAKREEEVYPADLEGGPLHYHITKSFAPTGGFASLIVPAHGLLRIPPTVSGSHPEDTRKQEPLRGDGGVLEGTNRTTGGWIGQP